MTDLFPGQGAHYDIYRVRASNPDLDTTTFNWETIWDTSNHIYGADMPVARVRVTNRLSRPAECEIEVPRIDHRGFPVKLGDYVGGTIDTATLAPGLTIISVYRLGVTLFSGVLISVRGAVDSDNLIFQCKDFTHFWEKAPITPTYATSSLDIFSIVSAIWSNWSSRNSSTNYGSADGGILYRRYTTPGGSFTTTMGKSVAFRIQEHENVMLADAIYQLSTIGGDGFQFQWFIDYITNTNNPPSPRIYMVSPYAYYFTHDVTGLYQVTAGQGTSNTVESVEWVLDASNLANEYIVAGYGQGSSQQRGVYRGPIPGGTLALHRSPLQAHIESDQSVRRNDHAVNRAKAGWKRTSLPQLTLRVKWTPQDWGGKLPYDMLRPGSRTEVIINDSFLQLTGTTMECATWGLEVDAGSETCTADLFVPDY